MLVKFRRRYFLKYAIKPWEELTIKDDYMFKKVMSYKRLCKRMLEKLLKIEINDIKYVEGEKTTKVAYVSKGIRLDVYVKDDKNTVYNVEMQVRNLQDNSLFKRIRYYQSVIDTDLLTVGDLYDTLNQTFVIFICPFSVLDGKRHIYTFKNICVEDKSIEMEDGATKMLISTKGMMNDVTPDVKAFLNYIDGILSDDDFVSEVDKTIKEIKERESERKSYMTYEMKILEEREYARREGREITLLENIRSLMKNMGLSAKDAMNALSVSPESQKQLAPLV